MIKVFGTLATTQTPYLDSQSYMGTRYRDVPNMTDDDCTAFVENHKLKIKKQEFVINVELSSEQSLAVDIYCDQDIGDGTDSGITTDNLANTTALESEYQCVMDLLATNLDILKAKHEYAELYLRTRRKHGVTSKSAFRHLRSNSASKLYLGTRRKHDVMPKSIFQRSNLEKLLDGTNPLSPHTTERTRSRFECFDILYSVIILSAISFHLPS